MLSGLLIPLQLPPPPSYSNSQNGCRHRVGKGEGAVRHIQQHTPLFNCNRRQNTLYTIKYRVPEGLPNLGWHGNTFSPVILRPWVQVRPWSHLGSHGPPKPARRFGKTYLVVPLNRLSFWGSQFFSEICNSTVSTNLRFFSCAPWSTPCTHSNRTSFGTLLQGGDSLTVHYKTKQLLPW